MSTENLGYLRKGGIYQYAKDNPVRISDKEYIIRTTEYALYPNRTQENRMLHTLDVCREVYNRLRNIQVAIIRRYRRQYGREWTECLKNRHHRIFDDRELSRIARAIWNKEGWMQDIYQNLLNDVSKRVYNAFNRYFDDLFKGRDPGYPDSNTREGTTRSPILTRMDTVSTTRMGRDTGPIAGRDSTVYAWERSDSSGSETGSGYRV